MTLVWWQLSKIHVVGSRKNRTVCGQLYKFDRGGGIVSSQWHLQFGVLNEVWPRKAVGCKRCAMHLPAGFDF